MSGWTIERNVQGTPGRSAYVSATHRIMRTSGDVRADSAWQAFWIDAPPGTPIQQRVSYHRTLAVAKRYATNQAVEADAAVRAGKRGRARDLIAAALDGEGIHEDGPFLTRLILDAIADLL